MNDVISLRQFIARKDEKDSVRVNTFCSLMKHVSDAIEKEDRNLIRINIDEIKINRLTGEIIFPENLFASSDLDKTISGAETGISIMADRKSSVQHKRVSFALMVLGWYANIDHSSVMNDMDVLDNFDSYMSRVPEWLQEFFVNVFRKMDYTTSFSDYYNSNFVEKVKSEVKETFKDYNLNDEQMGRIISLVGKTAKRMIKEGEQNGQF